jgi:transcriptional regulator with XRE-family HTH domain
MARPRGVTLPGLREARLRRFMTQEQLATAAGLSYHVINRAENGERVAVTTAQKLATALQVRPETLLGPAVDQGKALGARAA